LIVRPRAGEVLDVDQKALESELSAIMRNWQDDLRDELVQRHGEAGLVLAERYGRALPTGYIEGATPSIAAADVERLAGLASADDMQTSLHDSPQHIAGEGSLRFTVYPQHSDIALSDALPLMENMGLRVVAEHPHRIEVDGTPLYIQDFEVESASPINVARVGDAFTETFARVWKGDAENDGFNRLVLAAG